MSEQFPKASCAQLLSFHSALIALRHCRSTNITYARLKSDNAYIELVRDGPVIGNLVRSPLLNQSLEFRKTQYPHLAVISRSIRIRG